MYTLRSTVGSHEKLPASVQCRGKTTHWCYLRCSFSYGWGWG